jgi:hypothetical protein
MTSPFRYATHGITMKNKRFQTDRRLWLWVALALFLISWCFPLIGVKGNNSVRPIVWLWGLVASLFQSDFSAREFFGMSVVLIFFVCFSGVASIVAAWFVQCIVVMVRTKRIDSVA